MVNRIQSRVSVWWDGECVTVTLPTTTFYLPMQQTRLFGEEVLNRLLSVLQQDNRAGEIDKHVLVAGDLLSLEEAWFLSDRLHVLAGSHSPSTVPPPWLRRQARVGSADKVNWAKEGF